MNGFQYISNWEGVFTPTFSLIFGFLGFLSFVGLGNFVIKSFYLKIKKPWDLSFKILIGISIFSLINQSLAIFSIINSLTLYLVIFITLPFGFIEIRKIKKINFAFTKTNTIHNFLLTFIFSTKIFFCLVPTTKTDELFYHMLLPIRLLTDQTLTYYQMPWEGSILPHMHYQFIGTPFYFLGFPDSLNVISFLIFASFVYSFSIFVKEKTKDEKTSLWVTLIISTGLFTLVDIPTNASNAIMLLSASIASIIIAKPKYFFSNDIRSISIFYAFLLLGMVSAKISLIPISLVIYLIFLKNLFNLKGTLAFLKSIRITLITFIIFYLPLLIFTYIKSGSPYGPVPGILINDEISSDINFSQLSIYFFTKWSSLVWISWIIFPFLKISKTLKLNLISIFLVQLFFILFFFPTRPRFFGGIQYTAFIILAIKYGPYLFRKFKTLLVSFLICITLPLIILDLYYSYPIIYSAFSNPERFKLKYIPLYKDFKNIDKIVENNAQIIYMGFRVNSFHSPRKALMNFEDIKNNQIPTYLFSTNKLNDISSNKYNIISEIYSNKSANIYCYRTPKKECMKGQIFFYKLDSNTNEYK